MWKQWLSSSNPHEAEENVLKLSGDDFMRRKLTTELSPGRSINAVECWTEDKTGSEVEKPKLVLAHGFGAALAFWFKNYSWLAKNYHVYSFDWLGCGNSSRPEFNCKTPEEAEAFFLDSFEEWRAKLGIEDFVLVGHSLGGFLSTCYALQHPEHVRQLILVSPVGLPARPEAVSHKKPPLLHRMVRTMWEWDWTPQGAVKALGPLGPVMIGKFASRRFGSDVLAEHQVEFLQKYMYEYFRLPGSGEYALNTVLSPGAFARRPLCDRIHNLQVPVALLYGDNDWMDKRHALAVVPKMTVPAVVLEIPDAGHHLYLDNPDHFHEVILSETQKGYRSAHATALLERSGGLKGASTEDRARAHAEPAAHGASPTSRPSTQRPAGEVVADAVAHQQEGPEGLPPA